VATCAGMFRPRSMNAPDQPCRFIGVAGLALDRRHLVWMWVILDVGVALAAFQDAVNTRAKLVRINPDTVSR